MKYIVEKMAAPGREQVEVLGSTYEAGKPAGENMGHWRQKLTTREDKVKYIESAEKKYL